MTAALLPRTLSRTRSASTPTGTPYLPKSGGDGCDCADRPTLRPPSSFRDELNRLIQNEKQARSADSVRTQLSRSIQRSTGVRRSERVSEEQLFAGVVGTEVLRETDRRTYRAFADRVRVLSQSDATGRSAEDSAKIALNELVARGTITQRSANAIYARAFTASQLDTNDCALFDSSGGKRDESAAVTDFDGAVTAGTLGITKVHLGQVEVLPRSPHERAAGHPRSPSQLTHTARSTLEVA